ncbi:MAG: SAM-dependent methyltransferase [Ruminococcus sp.]|nr:SAM-dependent methyltransferase [Ruminococcus sp.]
MNKFIIDVCCGGRMFWFDKQNQNVEFCDNRKIEKHEFYPGRYFEVNPDTVCDFTDLPFKDGQFKLVVFDPPHLVQVGDKSWLSLKYGKLEKEWHTVIKKGFEECFRILDIYGVLIFKWSEVQIPLKEILSLCPVSPLFGNRSGRNNSTHWLCFMKFPDEVKGLD